MRRIGRLALPDGPAFVELEGGRAWPLDAAPWLGGERRGHPLAGYDDEGVGPCHRLAPVAPSKIVCVGRNYRAHAEELGNEVPTEPLLFFKPPSSLLAPDGVIELPPASLSDRVEHEAELGLVIGRRLRNASEDEGREAIWGCTVVGDVTARDMQHREKQWTRAKGFDTFCPVGPVVVGGMAHDDVAVRCVVNDELRQDGRTSAMIFPPAMVLAYISAAMTLEPGDLIATGTPAGVGPLVDGDRVRFEVEGIGTLVADVRRGEEPGGP
ncbi:MAG: fumarylacetoacetate hydrolase family protein [Polyangiaceae bacterium]